MNIRKDKLNLYKVIYMAMDSHLEEILTEEQAQILHLYLSESKGLKEIADILHFSDYHIVKDELNNIEHKILDLC